MTRTLDDIVSSVHKDRVARIERELEAMQVEGLTPAEAHEDWILVGIPSFHCAFRDAGNGMVELRIGSRHHRWSGRPNLDVSLVGEEFPRHPFSIEAESLVEELIESWPLVAAPYLFDDGHWPDAMFIELDDRVVLEFELVNGSLRVSSADVGVDIGEESVVVVECLRAVADTIVDLGFVCDDLSAAWKELSDATDLPRFAVTSDRSLPSTFASEETWYADKSGMGIDAWRSSAVDVHSRQVLYAAGKASEPTRDEWRPDWSTDRSDAEVRGQAEEAAKILQSSVDDLVEAGIGARLASSRQLVYEREDRRRKAFIKHAVLAERASSYKGL